MKSQHGITMEKTTEFLKVIGRRKKMCAYVRMCVDPYTRHTPVVNANSVLMCVR